MCMEMFRRAVLAGSSVVVFLFRPQGIVDLETTTSSFLRGTPSRKTYDTARKTIQTL